MARVLILGSYGLLGTVLCQALTKIGHQVFRQGRGDEADHQGDPNKLKDVLELLRKTLPDVVVNLVASTNVDACESDPQMAYLVNVRTIEILAIALRGSGIYLVHVSTDQVYDGSGPHKEDTVCPCNVYGLSKYTGELFAATIGATVLRTNFVGRSQVLGRAAFTDWIVKSMREQSPITLFDDVLFSALHMSTLSTVIEQAIQKHPQGTFNVGCVDGISKAQFALKLAERLGLNTSCITIGKSTDAVLKARRPLDMRLLVNKMESYFGIEAPTMAETLELVAKDYEYV
jgi:dTDP-4-dehydrorhamnose reductase